jgi:lactate dehydrogenase-like 2-hydroxyacid dehydrogenase
MSHPQSNTIPKLAILDDNLSISAPHFAHIPSSKVDITIFNDTLPPYNHPATSEEDKEALVNRLKPFDILSTMRERTAIPADLLAKLPNLKLLLVTGMRHNCFDMDSTKEHGIVVAAAVGHGRDQGPKNPADLSMGAAHPTTQHTWAMILGLARGISREDHSMRQGGWQEGPAIGTLGKTIGVAGMGRLGGAVARVGTLAFGMRVICWSMNLTQEKADEIAKDLGLPAETAGEKTFKVVSKEDLFRESDVLTLQYTLSPRSRHMVGKAELGLMKKTAMLINTSRGPLVDEEALIETLEKGGIHGAALDTFDIEPLPKSHPFRSYKWGTEGRSELLLSPHMGYVEKETLDAFYAETAQNLERWLDGKELLNRMV